VLDISPEKVFRISVTCEDSCPHGIVETPTAGPWKPSLLEPEGTVLLLDISIYAMNRTAPAINMAIIM
jgi:hypothetical protein